jgi:hypothetical protein
MIMTNHCELTSVSLGELMNLHYYSESPIIHLTDFSAFIETISDHAALSVKIGVISSYGVDASLDVLEGKITNGLGDYYSPSSNRGTIAARLITQICPKSQLYVAKVEEKGPTAHESVARVSLRAIT